MDNFSKEQEADFIKYLKDNGAGWWHMINNSWLVSSHSNDVTKESIRSELQKNFKGTLIVLNVTDSANWCGYGQTKDFEWLKANWDTENA